MIRPFILPVDGEKDRRMPLKIVGTGLGRTGTKSMHTALNRLGFGPCHHMFEVITRPESMPLWIAARAGRPDWDAIFKDYGAMVDYPGAAFWREIAAHYPDAKILHTVRDPDEWFDSTQSTIFAPDGPVATLSGPPADFFKAVLGDLLPHLSDRAWMTDHFRRHTDEVLAAFPAERVLVYEVGEGWDRLAAFLGVPAPDEPYPSENSRAEFIARRAAMAETFAGPKQ